MPNYHYKDKGRVGEADMATLAAPYLYKLAWFKKHGYEPHYWQLLFHCNTNPVKGNLTRFRHLVAGRRGGKTLSAAWEVLFYLLHPNFFHLDAHGTTSSRALWVWQLSKDYKLGFPALHTFRAILLQAGLAPGRDYREHKGDKFFEFPNGSRIDFKSADDPESLRGAGLDILWMDEAAFIPKRDAWDVVRPALSDKLGLSITTTTPDGKNWFHGEFWAPDRMEDPAHGRIEYTSIHNPYFHEEEWLEAKRTIHPMVFRREFMAAFDAMQGKELNGEWLRYYELADLPRKDDRPKEYDLTTYVGVDPAISLKDSADRFSMALVGVSKDGTQAYLLEQFAGRIPFHEQIDLIREWFIKYKPTYIGIEATAYQNALAQQAARIEGLPPIVPMLAKGKKWERIMAMAPLFKIGKVRIRADHQDFITEWIDYDSALSNPNDDCLDAVEIALRCAGALLPTTPHSNVLNPADYPAVTMQELSQRRLPGGAWSKDNQGVDDTLGGEW